MSVSSTKTQHSIIKPISDEDFTNEVLHSKILTIAYFWAPWSRATNLVTLLLDAIAENYKGTVKVVDINIQEHIQTAKTFKVRHIPTIIYFLGGKDVARTEGLASGNDIDMTIRKLLAVPA